MNNTRILRAAGATVVALALLTGLASAQSPVDSSDSPQASALAGTAFTYQGQLKSGGAPYSGACDLRFGLWNAVSGPAQIGSTQTKTNVSVAEGKFTVQLDFGSGAFQGDARWLAIEVRCPAGGGSHTALTPRQPLTASPYALALPGLWTQQHATSPNLIGGYSGNWVTSGVYAATIGGGGLAAAPNRVTDNGGTVGGGTNNQAGNNAGTVSDRRYATVGGGGSNTASGEGATVSGGGSNTASGAATTVAGGANNTVSGYAAAVGGGEKNTVGGYHATVGGGYSNAAGGGYATVGGGQGNAASAERAAIGGGYYNTANGLHATVAGGDENDAGGEGAAVSGGAFNDASNQYATIGGGYTNQAGGQYATVAGGKDNTANGIYATVPGGRNNLAAGDYSLAAGRRANANNAGCLVWGDSTDADITCSHPNSWVVRASGGITMYTNAAMNTGVRVPTGSGTWSSASDRALKDNVRPVDGEAILARLADVPIATWNYTAQDSSIRHIGPMAQDFYAAFEVGESDTHIGTVDADGVALAAIQGLHRKVQDQEEQIAALEARLAALEGAAQGEGQAGEWPLGLLPGAGLALAGIAWTARRGGGRCT